MKKKVTIAVCILFTIAIIGAVALPAYGSSELSRKEKVRTGTSVASGADMPNNRDEVDTKKHRMLL